MKRAILYTLAAVLLAPAAAGVLDLFWWFWTDNTATGIDWSGGRPVFAFLTAFFTVAFVFTPG